MPRDISLSETFKSLFLLFLPFATTQFHPHSDLELNKLLLTNIITQVCKLRQNVFQEESDLSQLMSHLVSFLVPSAHYLLFTMICWIQKLSRMPKCHFCLSTLFFQGPMHFCSLTSALIHMPAIPIAAISSSCQSHCTWPEGSEILSLYSQISRDWAHSTQHFWILILALFFTQTSREEQLLYQIPPPLGSFSLFILHFPSHIAATT